ncbi:MAG: ATP-sensitive inward rectifier potassium channel 10 [Caulobacteraceae bacterium]|nr:ATP-sensitive inward rectifier potassium channel 10 [Caulobacter sp.]
MSMSDDVDAKRVLKTPVPRFVERGDRLDRPRRNITVKNRPRDGVSDIYHHLLTMHWWQFALGAVALYLVINTLFAFLYWLDPHGLTGARPGSFGDSFDFSVETLGTIGYGSISPRSAWANTLVACEAFLNIAVTALGTGLTFARVSRPTARVMFADKALITDFEGARAFIFRVANRRDNQILEADVSVSLARNTLTPEGIAHRRLYDLPLMRQRSPMFALSWTVIHKIDEASPLHGATPESLAKQQAEIVIVLGGTDSTFASRVHARHSYVPSEIAWDAYYEDVIFPEADGKWVVDYARFDAVRAAPGAPAE